uniref:TSA: Wollemia nobilis Ref_Wollemi_Transcript_1847_1325 transcribed RNA sequence n=1 Tax=Wollemia nobilis TaxID=56998 RepID=A0A0C9RYY2_9CONI
MGSLEDKKPLKIVAGADDFGCALKNSLVEYLKEKGVEVEDLGTNKYYNVGEEVGRRVSSANPNDAVQTKGLVACGTGVGVSVFANKFPGVYAVTCDTVDDARNCRSINNSNVLAVGGMFTTAEEGKKIVDAWLETPFRAPCPASEGKPWPPEIDSFLENSVDEMAKITAAPAATDASSCVLCSLSKSRGFEPVDIMPGGSWSIVRESPTAAIVKFKGGSVEPAHHHTFGHDLVVLSGNKRVWNLTKKECVDLGPGDYLYTPAPDVHRVQYFTDTEFFIRWDGRWDIFLDEDLDAAAAAIKESTEKPQ